METYSISHESWDYILQALDALSDRGLQKVLDQLDELVEKSPEKSGELYLAHKLVENELEIREMDLRTPGAIIQRDYLEEQLAAL